MATSHNTGTLRCYVSLSEDKDLLPVSFFLWEAGGSEGHENKAFCCWHANFYLSGAFLLGFQSSHGYLAFRLHNIPKDQMGGIVLPSWEDKSCQFPTVTGNCS